MGEFENINGKKRRYSGKISLFAAGCHSIFRKTDAMFLKLNHQTLKAFEVSRSFVLECYKVSRLFP